MPVALYDSTRPAAINEKIAPETAPLTVRVRNFSTTSPSPSGEARTQTGWIGGSQEPPIRHPHERVLLLALHQARVALERHHLLVGGALDLQHRSAVGRDEVH